MKKPWEQVHPKDSYRVHLATTLTDLDQKVLLHLYQPILGPVSFSLYLTMWTEVEKGETSEQIQHAELLNHLNIGIPELYQARIRLEGLGLLKTFTKENDIRVFLYELQPPLSLEAFFQDDLLSLLLLESVGEKKFEKLIERFSLKTFEKKGYQEITRSFLDVYQFHPNKLQLNEKSLNYGASSFSKRENTNQLLTSRTFDWEFFVKSLDSLLVKKDEALIELKETIISLHHLYGIDELEMKDFVTQTADYITGQVKKNDLKRLVRSTYHQKQAQKVEVKDVMATTLQNETDQKSLRFNTLMRSGFTKKEIDVIQTCESLPPIFFVQSIKEQKGGFVPREEVWLIENLVQSSGLPNSVINILIHYILAVKNKASLTAGYMNPIANDWAQSKIYTPEAAMNKVKEMTFKSDKKITTTNKKWAPKKEQSSSRKETLPDWATQEPKEETPLNAEEEKYFAERIKNLTGRKERGEG